MHNNSNITPSTSTINTPNKSFLRSDTGPPFRHIGHGFCGTVWAVNRPGKANAIKREDGGEKRSILNDFLMHQNILTSISHIKPSSQIQASQNPTLISRITIPACHKLVQANDDTWWSERLPRFPKQFQIVCNALVTERIPPFNREVREALIDRYCPESIRESAKQYEPNQDCIIRAYLGRRRRIERYSRFKGFSLRNYPLHVDQMEELGLPREDYASVMAETLAIIHWAARIDANDVEFVLAPPRVSTESEQAATSPYTVHSSQLGEHSLWILDFDCCKEMAMNEAGVEQAWRAFYRNDPYYPRPGRDNKEDQRLWVVFRERFLEVSNVLLGKESSIAYLPGLLMSRIEGGRPMD